MLSQDLTTLILVSLGARIRSIEF